MHDARVRDATAKLDISLHPRIGQVTLLQEALKAGTKCIVSVVKRGWAEDLSDYLQQEGWRTRYLHSDIRRKDRASIVNDFRMGHVQLIVTVDSRDPFLRAGSVFIFDADENSPARTRDALTRIASHANRRVILCADTKTEAMCVSFPKLVSP